MHSKSALQIWQDRLERFNTERAIAASADIKFQLDAQIVECEQKIRELSRKIVNDSSTESSSASERGNPVQEKPSQALNISGGQMSNVQLGGIAGGDQTISQTQEISQGTSEKSLTQAEVSELIVQLETLFRNAGLPAGQAAKALKHLETAKEEVQKVEPDKDFAAKILRLATEVLKEAGETVDAGTGLWKKIQPIIETIRPWLGVAANFFW